MNAHKPITPICRLRIDSVSCSLVWPTIALAAAAAGAVDAERREFFGTLVRHLSLNSSSNFSVDGKNEQCNRPHRTCEALSRTSSTGSSIRRNTMACTCCTHSGRATIIGILLKTSTCITSRIATRADHEDDTETESMVSKATGIMSASVIAWAIIAINAEQDSANSSSCSLRSRRQASGRMAKNSARLPFVLRLMMPVIQWQTVDVENAEYG